MRSMVQQAAADYGGGDQGIEDTGMIRPLADVISFRPGAI